jgi:protein NUD1
MIQGKDDGALLQPSEPSKGKNVSPFLQTSSNPGAKNPTTTNKDASKVNSPALPADAGSGSDTPENTKKAKRGPSYWETLDAQFRRGLPDKAYAGRLAYRGLVMRACPEVKMLDDVRVSEKEKKKAEGLLRRVLEEVEASNVSARQIEKR